MRRFEHAWLIGGLAGLALAAGGLVALAEPRKGSASPDPPPHPSRTQWTFEVVARHGQVSVERATSATRDKPADTPRMVGRFALELYSGPELLDRVRFNVPLMGGESSSANRNRLPRPHFDESVTTRLKVRMADHPRAAYLLVVDRERGDIQKLAWPPEAGGRLLPWTSGLSDGSADAWPDGGVPVARMGDGGTRPAGAGDRASRDAGQDAGR